MGSRRAASGTRRGAGRAAWRSVPALAPTRRVRPDRKRTPALTVDQAVDRGRPRPLPPDCPASTARVKTSHGPRLASGADRRLAGGRLPPTPVSSVDRCVAGSANWSVTVIARIAADEVRLDYS